ncbi:ribosome biogenesis protein SLX9-domain-containing protein [Echria macrotheca]|uniref:Ribosome biogenesis protein SLX9 n=1 Tax=Echria macrotheca TaxID=438768 RepID=A0AAJ0FC27_9PEZI|nr:ribosome biogenesis protein SLX9-domain-containing protein [Echria macrotheca]
MVRSPNHSTSQPPADHPPPQAPTAPKRPSGRARARARAFSDTALGLKSHRPSAVITDTFINSKLDKRKIKHSSFVSRITKPSSSSCSCVKKRRRPSKKLVTDLESLGGALDDIIDEINFSSNEAEEDEVALGKIRHKSLRSRPGALKKKEKVVKGEMERFGKSLAQLAMMAPTPAPAKDTTQGMVAGEMEMDVEETDSAEQAAPPPSSTGSSQWAALRQFISSTMEQNPAFADKT